MKNRRVLFLVIYLIVAAATYAAAPEIPKVERVKPLSNDPLKGLPDVFFHEDLDDRWAATVETYSLGADAARRADQQNERTVVCLLFTPFILLSKTRSHTMWRLWSSKKG